MVKDLTKLPRPVVKLVGEDGNAFSILGRASKEMRVVGWKKDEIDQFMNEATSGDYDHLLRTVIKYCDESEEGGNGYEFEE